MGRVLAWAPACALFVCAAGACDRSTGAERPATGPVVVRAPDPSAPAPAPDPSAPAPAPAPAALSPVPSAAPAAPSPSAEAAPAGDPPEVARPYDEAADAQAQIDAALVASRRDGKRVLLVFGANWCPWCRRLEHTLQNDAQVAAALRDHFRVVHVDTGARRSGTNAGVVARYGNPVRLGLPVLVVLAVDGTVAHTQETGALEVGDRHSPAKVLEALARMRG